MEVEAPVRLPHRDARIPFHRMPLWRLEESGIQSISFTPQSTVSNLATLVGENRLLHLLEGWRSPPSVPSPRCLPRPGVEGGYGPHDSTIKPWPDEIASFFFLPKD